MLIRSLISLLFLLPASMTFGQATENQISHWIESLSQKKDPRFLQYRAVWQEIGALDSSQRCEVLQQLSQHAMSAALPCQIRVGYYQLLAGENDEYKCVFPETKALAEQALNLAYEIEDPFLIAMGNRLHAGKYRSENEFGMAMMHLYLAIDAQDSLGTGHFYDIAFDQYMLGELQYHSREYAKAIASLKRALEYNAKADPAVEKTIPLHGLMFLHNTMGLAYDKLEKYDSAFIEYDKALALAPRTRMYQQWGPLLQGNRGDVFYKLGQYDSAYVLLQKDVAASLRGGPKWASNAATSMQWLARINIKRNKATQALQELHEANRVLKQGYNAKVQAHIYYGFMEAFEKLGMSDSLLFYTEKYIATHDSIERKATEAQAEIVQVRLDNQNSIDRIKALNKEKQRIAMIRNFIILTTLMAFGFGLLYYNRQRLKMKLDQQRAQEEARKAETEAIAARDLLDTFTQHLLEKNTLVETLQAQLSTKELNDEQVQTISALSNHAILTDDDWDQFKMLFEKVYPGFLHHLKNIAPDITSAELRFAALSKLRISTREASNLLGISPSSVNKTRQRLRHRLDLNQDVDLEEFFNAPVSTSTSV
jgi:tetratricopeptide (TPR) repeat protein/DNA-binding CsgD family transcriptional regulator